MKLLEKLFNTYIPKGDEKYEFKYYTLIIKKKLSEGGEK